MPINKIENNPQTHEGLKITGLNEGVKLIKERLHTDNLSAITIDGPAGAGKSWFSMILAKEILPKIKSEDLNFAPTTLKTSLPQTFQKYVDINPSIQATNNILGVDLFYHDRKSEERKRSNIFHWLRRKLLREIVLDILEKKKSGKERADIELNAFLHSANLENRKYSLPISQGPLIIEGFGAMSLVPELEKMGYNTLNIAVVAKKDIRLERGRKRGESRGKDSEKTLSHLENFTEPTWKKYWKAAILNNLDLVVKSEYNNMNLLLADKLSEDELRNLLK